MTIIKHETYPAAFIEQEDGSFLVKFYDLPEAITFGKDRFEAIKRAMDCLYVAMRARERDGDPIPRPSKVVNGAILVTAERLPQ